VFYVKVAAARRACLGKQTWHVLYTRQIMLISVVTFYKNYAVILFFKNVLHGSGGNAVVVH